MSSKFLRKLTVFSFFIATIFTSLTTFGGAVSGLLYYTRYQSPNEVKHVNFSYDGTTNFVLSNITSIATFPSGADGLTMAPDGDLVIGACNSGLIFKVNPTTGSYASIVPGGGSCHLALDPSRTKAWAGFAYDGYSGGTALSEIPLNPFTNGIPHAITGDDTVVGTLAWDVAGNCYYTVSQPSGVGNFGLLNLSTFVTKRLLTAVPAAHGMAYDPLTKTFILFGNTHVTQVSATTTNATILGDLSFGGTTFDQGTVDGAGHLFAAENNGSMLFIDYTASGYITNGFAALKFLDTYLDDVAPIGLVGNGNLADIILNVTTTNSIMVRSNFNIVLTITNAGPSNATSVVLSDTLPVNANFVNATTSAGTWSISNGVVTVQAGNLNKGSVVTVTIQLQGISGNLLNHAVVTANETDPYFANNIVDTAIAAPNACMAPLSGVVGLWSGEGNALDSIGTNHGVILNTNEYGPGFVGQSFLFNGVNDYVNIADNATMRPTNLTIELWASFDAYNGVRQIFGKAVGSGDADSYVIWIQDGVLHAYTHFVTGDGPVMSYTMNPPAGVWFHLAFTVDNTTSNQVLYVNGTPVASQKVSGVIDFDTHPLQIGADYANGNIAYSFIGRLDEATLYNRALTPAEIKSIYYSATQGKCGYPVIVPAKLLQSGTTNRPYAVAFTMAHASPPFTFSNPGGGLPPGLTLLSDGTLSGVPTTLGSYNFTLTATDAFANVVQTNFTLSIVPWAVMPSGLLAWWRGETNSLDALGYHNGANSGGVSYVPGYDGYAFKFDGSSGYVNAGTWSPGARWTVEAWVSPLSIQTGEHIIAGGIQDCFDWGISIQDGQLAAPYRPPGGCSSSLLSGVYARVGLWYHVAETVNGTNVILYVNGIARATNVVEPNYIGTAKGVLIGDGICCSYYLNALVDEPAVFNRPLTPAEIAALYTAGSAGKSTIGPGPVITSAPTNTTAAVGSSASLCVTATGVGTLSYQWYQNGIPIPGATSSCLTVSPVQGANYGALSVMVANTNGVIPSAAVTLTTIDLKVYAGITINGLVGGQYRIDYGNSLSSPLTTLTNITLPSTPYIFIDYTSAGQPQRFYKVTKTN